MKVNIKGNNPITSQQFASVIDSLNLEYEHLGLKVKNMTCYVRFVNQNGETVEPKIHHSNGYIAEIEKTFTFNKTILLEENKNIENDKP